MSNTSSSDDTSPRVLGEYEITVEEARHDDNFRVLELPADMVNEHLTKTFTPSRYAKVCRDVAYFASKVGKAPQRSAGGGTGSPGSGMRRSKEGALYNLMHRGPLLKRAIEMDLISITNEDGFDATEGQWQFELTSRGAWFLHQYYGPHAPIRKVTKKKLSRHSAATNVSKHVVDLETAESAKSVDVWNEQVDSHKVGGDVQTGYYRVSTDTVEDPEKDAAGEELVFWIDESRMPKQFDIDALESDVLVRCDVDALAEPYKKNFDIKYTSIRLDADTDDIVIAAPATEAPVTVTASNSQKIGISGDYDPLVTSGAKDALKETTDAQWSEDYQVWYVVPDEFLQGIEAMLKNSSLDMISCPAHVIAEYSEYL